MNSLHIFKNLFLVILMTSSTALAKAPWFTNIEEGVKKAKAENRLVMVQFTGSDWCPPCIMMDKQVFSKKEFLAKAQENYVLVKLDMPKSNPKLQESTKKLLTKYKVEGIPTILLLDAEGKEFKRFSATENSTVKGFINRLVIEKRRKKML